MFPKANTKKNLFLSKCRQFSAMWNPPRQTTVFENSAENFP